MNNRPQVGMWLVACVLAIMTFTLCLMWWRIRILEQRLNTVRFAMPGRTKASVIAWLGKPTREKHNVTIAGRVAPTIMYYSSTVPGRRPDAASDIWVVLSQRDIVEAVYYPDIPIEKGILFGEK
ncbi:MAG: hypothetical protein M3347_14040 [Armatimonadota bacterium]|nr:hypothetical protein [Armatimonadota bacterium]